MYGLTDLFGYAERVCRKTSGAYRATACAHHPLVRE